MKSNINFGLAVLILVITMLTTGCNARTTQQDVDEAEDRVRLIWIVSSIIVLCCFCLPIIICVALIITVLTCGLGAIGLGASAASTKGTKASPGAMGSSG